MKCDLIYCIYNAENRCALNEIRIDTLGMCDQCILVFLSSETLEVHKAEQREAMDK